MLLGPLAVVAACSRDRAPETGSATMTGAPTATSEAQPVTVEEVRNVILDRNPTGPEVLRSVIITNENDVITLRGTVPDEDTRSAMINRVRRIPNVKGVRDELTVAPKGGAMQGATTTPQTMPTQAQTLEEPSKPGMQGTTSAATKTKTTDAIRTALTKDNVAPPAVVNGLVLHDDGNVVTLSGTVPDHKTHAAILSSAKKAAGAQLVQDNLTVSDK